MLILRDVLGWRAAEVAGLLGTSAPAVNSALQRAREHLELTAPAEDDVREPTSPADRELVGRYAAAFENADMAALVALLREDAVLEMPPLPGWFRGAAVAAFLGTRVLAAGQFRMIPTARTGSPRSRRTRAITTATTHTGSACSRRPGRRVADRHMQRSRDVPGFGFPARLPAGEREPVPCGG